MKNKGMIIIETIPKTCKECKFSIHNPCKTHYKLIATNADLYCVALKKYVNDNSKDKDCPIHKI